MKPEYQFINCHSHRKPENEGVFVCRNAYHLLPENSIVRLPYPVSAGMHPWHAARHSLAGIAHLRRLLLLPGVIALGEAGLDKRKGPAFDVQLKCWNAQFALAQETGVSLIVHCVRAWQEMLPFVRSTEVPLLFHDFRGNQQMMESYVRKDNIFFSFGSNLLTSDKSRLVFSLVPDGRFLLETDQAAIRIAEVYRAAAEIRGCKSSELEAQVKKNAGVFFGEKVLSFF